MELERGAKERRIPRRVRERRVRPTDVFAFNWIHPFAGGNGRTSRAVAYLIVCMDAGRMLPGVPSMPSLIYDQRDEYLVALRAADASLRGDEGADVATREPDTAEITTFLKRMLTRQLASAIDRLSSA